MAKFAAVLSLLLVLAVTATAHKTITTTVVVEDEKSNPQQCREKVKRMDFNHCMQFLGGSGGRQMLRSIVGQAGQMSEHLRPCCQQLQKVEEECQCDAAGFVIQEHERKMGGGTAGSPEMKVIESLMLAECGMLKCEQGGQQGGQQFGF